MKKYTRFVAVMLLLCVVVSVCACRYTSNTLIVTEPAASIPQGSSAYYQPTGTTVPSVPGTSFPQESTTLPIVPSTTLPQESTTLPIVPPTTLPQESTTLPPVESTSVPGTEPSQERDPSSWSKDEVLKYLADAVNKTKAYTGQVSVHRSESFTINIEEISPNLPALKNLANSLIGKFIKPVDEDITFNGGKAMSEGEEIPLLLPKRQGFTLPAEGVANAAAVKNGNNVIVDITLVSENSSMDAPPRYNAQSHGYLDLGSVDISMLTIEALDLGYLGSTMHAVIGPDGYVLSADYVIPLHIEASGKALGLKGSFKGSASQTEKWVINW